MPTGHTRPRFLARHVCETLSKIHVSKTSLWISDPNIWLEHLLATLPDHLKPLLSSIKWESELLPWTAGKTNWGIFTYTEGLGLPTRPSSHRDGLYMCSTLISFSPLCQWTSVLTELWRAHWAWNKGKERKDCIIQRPVFLLKTFI